MSEPLAVVIANVLVICGWLGTTSFILAFHLKSDFPWYKSLVGRTMMQRAFSMWALLSYALSSRLLEPVPEVQRLMAITIYAFIVLMEWRLFFVLRFIQEGKITLDHPNYTPFRDWWRRHFKKRNS